MLKEIVREEKKGVLFWKREAENFFPFSGPGAGEGLRTTIGSPRWGRVRKTGKNLFASFSSEKEGWFLSALRQGPAGDFAMVLRKRQTHRNEIVGKGDAARESVTLRGQDGASPMD
ncbi:MAG TPA: hypothetical protein VMA86_12260 [Acetobacteraceae bacterium]|nr:hypothetical protein [Acetobacteraceae bacterium]